MTDSRNTGLDSRAGTPLLWRIFAFCCIVSAVAIIGSLIAVVCE